MSKATERLVLGMLIAIFAVALFSLTASAFKWVCLYNGETYQGTTCSVPLHPVDGVCLFCAGDSGGSVPQYNCNNVTQPACFYNNNTCFPDSTKSCNLTGGAAGIRTCSANKTWGNCAELPSSTAAMLARIVALEQWRAGADTNLASLNTRLTLLEQWKLTIQATVDSLTGSLANLTSSLNAVKSWLGFGTYSTFCQAAGSCGFSGGGSCTESWQCSAWGSCIGGMQTRICTDTNACGTTVSKPAVSQSCSSACTENWQCGSWGTCQPTSTQTRSCNDLNACGTTISKPAVSQACNYTADPRIVTFRTNAPTKYDYGSSTSEIVLDSNGDGVLECFKYYSFYSTYFESMPTTLAKTPEGLNVNKYNAGRVIIDYGQKFIYTPSTGCTTPTTKVPTAPYSTNGREVYK